MLTDEQKTLRSAFDTPSKTRQCHLIPNCCQVPVLVLSLKTTIQTSEYAVHSKDKKYRSQPSAGKVMVTIFFDNGSWF